MWVALFFLSLISFAIGALAFAAARSPVAETVGGVFWIIAAILFVGSAIVKALVRIEKHLERKQTATNVTPGPLVAPTLPAHVSKEPPQTPPHRSLYSR